MKAFFKFRRSSMSKLAVVPLRWPVYRRSVELVTGVTGSPGTDIVQVSGTFLNVPAAVVIYWIVVAGTIFHSGTYKLQTLPLRLSTVLAISVIPKQRCKMLNLTWSDLLPTLSSTTITYNKIGLNATQYIFLNKVLGAHAANAKDTFDHSISANTNKATATNP